MDVFSLLEFLMCLLCVHGTMREGRYNMRDQDMGTSEGVIVVASARSRLQCITLCMATDQCVTAGFVDNQCTLSTKRIDDVLHYSKFSSTGERLYSRKYHLVDTLLS